ncbi:MAG: type VI secretion system baseplate subunit TssE [Burkholderiaceae bacterium]|jgi:type VI secretion system protein ImpF|nr:type VI secretion system baseplate subunit TssE [Burkholderiaceae bacterium]
MATFEPGLFDKLFHLDRRGLVSSTLRVLSLDDLKNALARDLEALLNTRMAFTEDMLEAFPKCAKSVLTYGINDFSGLALASHDDRAHICASLTRAIERHEPRLQQVNVTLRMDESARSNTNVLYFGILAKLTLPGISESVSYDAFLQPTILQYSVARSRTAGREVAGR